MFTQNIDGLEAAAGVSRAKLVHAHGSLATASCLRCRRSVAADAIRADNMEFPSLACAS